MAKVREIMRASEATVARDTPIAEVAEVLLRTALPGVPVVDDDGRVAGVVLLDDLVIRGAQSVHLVSQLTRKPVDEVLKQFVAEERIAKALTAGDIMRTDIPTAEEDDPTLGVANCMADARCDLVPVVREGKPVGAVTKHDLLRSIHWRREPPAGDTPNDD